MHGGNGEVADVNTLQRAWHVYAYLAQSEAAKSLKVFLLAEIVMLAYRLWAPEDWPPISYATLMQVVLWYALLWFVRERDEARAQLKAKDSERT
jgi:hypothetical protein